MSEEDIDDNEALETDGELQIITECWIEPQEGVIRNSSPERKYLNLLTYKQVPEAIWSVDLDCISSVITLEHLCLLCKNETPSILPFPRSDAPMKVVQTLCSEDINSFIYYVPFCFDLLGLLPKCQQAELLFSTYIQELEDNFSSGNVNGSKTNEMLFQSLLQQFAKVHDNNIELSATECNGLMKHVLHRTRSCQYSPPFTQSVIDSNERLKSKETSNGFDDVKHAAASTNKPVKWLCFVKKVSSTHVSFTLIPASYQDLKRLIFPNGLSPHAPCKAVRYKNFNHPVCDEAAVKFPKEVKFAEFSVPPDCDKTVPPTPVETKKSNIRIRETVASSKDRMIHFLPDSRPNNNLPRSTHLTLNEREDNQWESMRKVGSLTLPIYVYDCPLSGLIDRALYPSDGCRYRDIFHDFIYKMDDTVEINNLNGDSNAFSDSNSYDGYSSKYGSPESKSYDSDYPADRTQLKQHCNLIGMMFAKSYVDTVYNSLIQELPVDSSDINAVVDGICEETLIEINITSFLQAICAHVRDFKIKTNVENHNYKKNIRTKPSKMVGEISKNRRFNPKFPLSLLKEHKPCEELEKLHREIKSDFVQILKENFEEIPSNPDYLFYIPPSPPPNDQQTDFGEDFVETSFDDNEFDHDTTFKSVEFSEDLQNDSDSSSHLNGPWPDTFNNKPDSEEGHIPDTSGSSQTSTSCGYPPLFLSLTCSIKSQIDLGSLTVQTVPTCLDEIWNCLEANVDEIDLNNLTVTLDIIRLALPNDWESGFVQRSNRMRHTTSFCSTSSPGQDAPDTNYDNNDDSQTHSRCYSVGNEVQQNAIKKVISKIHWLLTDEVSSSLLKMYPITSSTLDIVSNHIRNSDVASTCKLEEVPLQFVFGKELSLDKFIPEFRRLTLPNYHLKHEAQFYYLVKDYLPENENSVIQSSLLPPLAILTDLSTAVLHAESVETRVVTGAKPKPLSISSHKNISSKQESSLYKKMRKDSVGTSSGKESDTESDLSATKTKKLRKTIPRDVSSHFKFDQDVNDSDLDDEPIGHSSPKKIVGSNDSTRGLITPIPKLSEGLNALSPQKQSKVGTLQQGLSSSFKRVHKSIPKVQRSSQLVSTSSCESYSPESKSQSPSSLKACRRPRRKFLSSHGTESISDSESNANTNEDGYEGGSDLGSESDDDSNLDIQRSLMPEFWLIMEIKHDAVLTYFHASRRIQKEEDEDLIKFINMQKQLIIQIKSICKRVNQKLLLQNLNETRVCQILLVPETSDDIWKSGTDDRHQPNPYDIGLDDSDYGYRGDYLAETVKLKPGAFSCEVVWETVFFLHHRLYTGHARSGVSRGMQALLIVLNPFTVNNRKNMFVYKESCGSVYYLRLHELTQQTNPSPSIMQDFQSITKGDDETSPGLSRCSSALSLGKRGTNESMSFDIEDFRPRTLSGTSEKDQNQDNISWSSKMSGPKTSSRHAICLKVHGITEPSPEITEVLVKVLQKQLDDAVLDVICTTLERNPQCKLTPADVQFIQKSNVPPTLVLHFTLPVHAMPYLQAVKFYLRQNLGLFLSNQKYTDPRPETHFQGFVNGATDCSTPEEDVFLYNRPITSGNKGIACLVLSIIDSQGQKIQLNPPVKPSTIDFKATDLATDFESITATMGCDDNQMKSMCSGSTAPIQFQVWEKGAALIETLEENLLGATQNSLWDLYMEYKLIIAPLCAPVEEPIVPSFCSSEPSTPLKKGRSGSSTSCKDFGGDHTTPFTFTSSHLKEHSHSIPDVRTGKSKVNAKSPKPPLNIFSKTNSSDLESTSSKMKEELERNAYEVGNSGHLLPFFFTFLVDFLKYGDDLNVPSVDKMSCKIKSEHSASLFLNEVQKLVLTLSPNSDARIFKNRRRFSSISDFNINDTAYVPVTNIWSSKLEANEEEIQPGETMDYVLVARNSQEQKTYNSSPNPQKELKEFLPQTNSIELPSEDGMNRFSLKDQAVGSNAPSPSPSGSVPTHNYSVLIPRQQLMILLLKNKTVNVLLYNWQHDLVATLFKNLNNLSQWHCARAKVLNNIILQKMGLFHRELQKPNDNRNPFLVSPISADIFIRVAVPQQTSSNRGSNRKSGQRHNQQAVPNFKEIFRNAKPSQPLNRTSACKFRDPLHQYGTQVLEIRNSDRKEIDKKLCNIWHNRGSTYDVSITDEVLMAFKRKSRMFHYCMSPFLFVLSWKLQCGLTRDHSVPAVPQPPMRKRNESGISIRSSKHLKVDAKPQIGEQRAPRERKESGSEEEWHVALCTILLREYAQYLQTLGGYVCVKTRPVSPRKQMKSTRTDVNETCETSSKLNFPKIYLVKSVLGGLIGIEIGYVKPFFTCRLYGLNCILLQRRGCNLLNSQMTLFFLDECDKMKVLMHLHSFTFDFHLFTIYSYLSGCQLLFRQGYHIISFLDDFSKYYEKSPMFARNRLHADSLIVPDTSCNAEDLFEYILKHDSLYKMKVFSMNALHLEHDFSKMCEHALIKLSTHRVCYRDSNDIDQSEEFNLALVVCHDAETNSSDPYQLVLKFFMFLTSRKGLYPKLSLAEDSGTFQIVHSCNRRKSMITQPASDIFNELTSMAKGSSFDDEVCETSADDVFKSDNWSEPPESIQSPGSMCKEAVNYLGYFSSEESVMFDVLQGQAKAAQIKLKEIVQQAMVDCRRDNLWERLLVGVDDTKKKRDENKECLLSLNFGDFEELLTLVCRKPLSNIDSELTPFFNMHLSWYQSLVKVLLVKYSDSCRLYTSNDGSLQHVVILDPNYLDTFILMSISQKLNKTELCTVSRDISSQHGKESSSDKGSTSIGVHSLIEGFIGACCFHLWCKLL